jgi:hypothetical protein
MPADGRQRGKGAREEDNKSMCLGKYNPLMMLSSIKSSFKVQSIFENRLSEFVASCTRAAKEKCSSQICR